ncbi:MAG TPA: M48 family metallopeptidase [Gemmatimonadaceae bacterium]|nr:M48 family metallopeptidase [Gemmatimonadaceae bacterium]
MSLRPAVRNPDRSSTSRLTRTVAVLALALSVACQVSEDQEVQLGRQNAEQVNAQLRLVRDPVVTSYVRDLGLSIAKTTSRADLDWQFFIVDSREVNAFALPGGFIYVNRGLIERAQHLDELAGALGHEIGHVVRRHSVSQMEKQTGANVAVGLGCTLTRLCNSDVARAAIQVGGAALFARYSRRDEAEADSEAVVNVIRAGLDPEGIPVLFRRLIEERRTSPLRIEAFFASHPLEEDRIRATEREIEAIDPSELKGLRRDDPSYQAFRAAIDALPHPPEPRPQDQVGPEQLRSGSR